MAKRVYKNAEGVKIPSVTTILGVINKPALIQWANCIGLEGIKVNEYVDDKADIGTLAHSICEYSLVGTPIHWKKYTQEQIKQACKCSQKFFEWKSYQWEFIPIASEIELISNKYQYGGCIDLLAIVNGRLTLIDFKTCNSIWNEAKYQVSAYKQLINENLHNIRKKYIIPRKYRCIQDVAILRIGRDEEEGFEFLQIENTKEGFQIFKLALNLYKQIKSFTKKKVA